MMHYRKGENIEQEITKDSLPFGDCLPKAQPDFLWMQVKGGTKVNNVITYAKNALDKGEYRSVVWSGSGGGVVKTVSCAEILKRSYPLYQVTRMCYTSIEEHWIPQMDGLEEIVANRKVPCLHILMSLDAIDDSVHGNQMPPQIFGWIPIKTQRRNKVAADSSAWAVKVKAIGSGNQNPKSKHSNGHNNRNNRIKAISGNFSNAHNSHSNTHNEKSAEKT